MPKQLMRKLYSRVREMISCRWYDRKMAARAAVMIAALLVAALPAAGAGAPKTLYVRCGRLIYDAEKPPLEHAQVIIEDGKIKAVGTALVPPKGAEPLDLSRYTVIPGLLDAHTHLWTGAFFTENPSDPLAALRASKAVAYALDSGVVAMRILDSQGFIDVALRDAIDEGTIPGPHIIPAAHAITIPGGHGDFFAFPPSFPMRSYYTPLNGFVNSPAETEEAVHLQIKYGAKVIKILASGGVLSPIDSPDAVQLTPEEMRVAVEEAHMAHLKVAAHAENLQSIMDALRAGVDSIEHGSGADQTAFDFMKAHGVYYDPTLYVVDNAMENGAKEHLPDYVLTKGRELARRHFASFKLGLHSGVLIAAGSDQVYQPGKGTVLNELVTLVKYGMTPQQALVAGTKHSADLLGLHQLGTIEAGKEGDLVALAGNPLDDIHAVLKPQVVVYQGKVVVDLPPEK